MLDSQFEPREASSSHKRKPSFKATIHLGMRGLMKSINPNLPNHIEFMSMTEFGCDITFDKFNYKNLMKKQKKLRKQEFWKVCQMWACSNVWGDLTMHLMHRVLLIIIMLRRYACISETPARKTICSFVVLLLPCVKMCTII